MRMIFAAALVLSGALIGTGAMAQTSANGQTQACYEQARRQVLQGEALSSFMTSCTSGQAPRTPMAGDALQSCVERAKMFSGEDRIAAMRACGQ